MAKKKSVKKKVGKKNEADLTRRNLVAQKKRNLTFKERLAKLEKAVKTLQKK